MSLRTKISGGVGLAVGAAAASYPLLWRRWCLNWGATPDETAGDLPGDELLPDPDLLATRAITIGAPPDAIWPWLVQMGSGRGGAYTYDWIENLLRLDMHSADEILPQFQDVKVGDEFPLGRTGKSMRVEVPPRGCVHDRLRGPDLGVDLRSCPRARRDQADQQEPDRHARRVRARAAVHDAVHGARQPGDGAQDAPRHQGTGRAPRPRSRR